MDLYSAMDIHKQSNPEPMALGNLYVNIVLYSCPAILSFGMLTQMIICIVLIVVIFLGLMNHIME
jgi:hypothetical protein